VIVIAGQERAVTHSVAGIVEVQQDRIAVGVGLAHADQTGFQAIDAVAAITFMKNDIARGVFSGDPAPFPWGRAANIANETCP
jgi:hypothetical protein